MDEKIYKAMATVKGKNLVEPWLEIIRLTALELIVNGIKPTATGKEWITALMKLMDVKNQEVLKIKLSEELSEFHFYGLETERAVTAVLQELNLIRTS